MIKRTVFRDRKGRFSKYHKGKILTAIVQKKEKGKWKTVATGPKQLGKYYDSKPKIADLSGLAESVRMSVTTTGTISTVKFKKNDQSDYYNYLHKKNFNNIVKKLKKANPNKVIVARITVKGRKGRAMTTPDFVVTDFNETHFISGKRKGKKYTPKDIAAAFLYDKLNIEQFTPFRDGVSENAKKKGYKKRKGATYIGQQQDIQINFEAISKRSAKTIRDIETLRAEQQIERSKRFERIRKGKVSSKSGSGRRKRKNKH